MSSGIIVDAIRGGWNETWPHAAKSYVHYEDTFPFSYLTPLMTHLETDTNTAELSAWSRRWYWMGPLCGVLYVIGVLVGRAVMEKRQAFSLKKPLLYWNIFLAIFSIHGTIRLVPQVFMNLYTIGLTGTLCAPATATFASGTVGFYNFLFVMSKYFELMDTVFIVLRKRKLYFLHWYHHLMALIVCWDGFAWEQPGGLYYAAMNYAVHAIMYSYYSLAMVGKLPTWGPLVTILQILQMVIGTGISAYTIYLSVAYPMTAAYFTTVPAGGDVSPSAVAAVGVGCVQNTNSAVLSMVLYSTFLYLFVRFFVHRFIMKKPELSHDSSLKVATVMLKRMSISPAFPDIATIRDAYIKRRVSKNTLEEIEGADRVVIGNSTLKVQRIQVDSEEGKGWKLKRTSSDCETDTESTVSVSGSMSVDDEMRSQYDERDFEQSGTDRLVTVRLTRHQSWLSDASGAGPVEEEKKSQ